MKKLIYENKYEGFESLFDWDRDMSEAIDEDYNEELKKLNIPGEFQGTFIVKVWYEDEEI